MGHDWVTRAAAEHVGNKVQLILLIISFGLVLAIEHVPCHGFEPQTLLTSKSQANNGSVQLAFK